MRVAWFHLTSWWCNHFFLCHLFPVVRSFIMSGKSVLEFLYVECQKAPSIDQKYFGRITVEFSFKIKSILLKLSNFTFASVLELFRIWILQ